jgi:hypothetical protein
VEKQTSAGDAGHAFGDGFHIVRSAARSRIEQSPDVRDGLNYRHRFISSNFQQSKGLVHCRRITQEFEH